MFPGLSPRNFQNSSQSLGTPPPPTTANELVQFQDYPGADPRWRDNGSLASFSLKNCLCFSLDVYILRHHTFLITVKQIRMRKHIFKGVMWNAKISFDQ